MSTIRFTQGEDYLEVDEDLWTQASPRVASILSAGGVESRSREIPIIETSSLEIYGVVHDCLLDKARMRDLIEGREMSVVTLCAYLNMDALKMFAEHIVASRISPENVLQMLSFCAVNEDCDIVTDGCFGVLCDHASVFLVRGEFLEILQQREGRANDFFVFLAKRLGPDFLSSQEYNYSHFPAAAVIVVSKSFIDGVNGVYRFKMMNPEPAAGGIYEKFGTSNLFGSAVGAIPVRFFIHRTFSAADNSLYWTINVEALAVYAGIGHVNTVTKRARMQLYNGPTNHMLPTKVQWIEVAANFPQDLSGGPQLKIVVKYR